MDGSSSSKFSVALDASKLKRPRTVLARDGPSITGSREDLIRQESQHKQYVTGVSEAGKLEADPSLPSVGGSTKLVIPLPSATAANLPSSSPLPSVAPSAPPPTDATEEPADEQQDLDRRAAEELIMDLMGHRKQSTLVIRQKADEASASPTENAELSISASKSKNIDPGLMNKLFAPNQKRVKGDGSALPLLLRNRVVPLATEKGSDQKQMLQADLNHRADDVDVRNEEVFERVPIEEYGAALLRGMGVDEKELEASLESGPATKREHTREKLGVGAASNPLIALQKQQKLDSMPKKPGQTAPTPTPQHMQASKGPSKADLIAAIRAKKFPGVVLDALVTITSGMHAGRIALVTQTDGVPGLEKCRVRALLRTVVQALEVGERQLQACELTDTEEFIIGKSLCTALSELDQRQPMAKRLVKLQEIFRAEKLEVSAPPAVPGLTPADAEAIGESRTETVEEAAAATHHTGEPSVSDEVHRNKRGPAESLHYAAAPPRFPRIEGAPSSQSASDSLEGRHTRSGSDKRERRRSRSRSHSPKRRRDRSRSGSERRSDRHDRDHRGSRRDSSREKSGHGHTREPDSRERGKATLAHSWLQPGISVRIVDSKYGKYFRMKAMVQDVTAPGFCTIVVPLDNGTSRIFDDVPQSALSTALPKVDGAVFVIRGKYKGTDGVLLERQPEEQRAVVQLQGDYEGEIVALNYDDVAELVTRRH